MIVGREGAGSIRQTGGSAAFTSLKLASTYRTSPAAPAATYTLDGGEVTAGSIHVGGGGDGLFVQNGGKMTIGGFLQVIGEDGTARFELRGGELTTNFERLTALSPGSAELVQIGGKHTIRSLKIDTGGKLTYSGGTLKADERVEVAGEIDFRGSDVTMRIGDRAFVDFSQATFTNSSNASIIGGFGAFMTFPSGFDLHSFRQIASGGLISIANQLLRIRPTQMVSGTGTIPNDVINEGSIIPGNSPGKLTIAGRYTQEANGSLFVEIAGWGEDQVDFLSVMKDAVLDGQLSVTLLDGFVPSPEDRFVFLSAAALSGRFANASDYIAFDQGSFDVIYTSNSVILTHFASAPIPEPAGFPWVLPLVLLGRRRSCRGTPGA